MSEIGPRRAWPRGSWIWLFLGLVAVVALGTVAQRTFYGERPARLHQMAGATMGTTWSLKVSLPEGAPLPWLDAIRDTVQSRLDRVETLMSTWDSTSEISRFNRSRDTSAVALSTETMEVLAVAAEVGRVSGGAFDVTVAPLVNAWGFGPGSPATGGPPALSKLDSLRLLVGFDRILLDVQAGTAAKADPAVAVDLSAVAKGYAVDRAADGVARLGVTDFALEVGGEVRASGLRPDGTPWRVAVEAPLVGSRAILRVLEVRNEAVATSGDYRNFFDVEGTRYAHIIDPRTGRPVEWKGFSVTVLHSDAARADAWATALSVLGPQEGLVLAKAQALAALFVITREDGSFEVLVTRSLQDRLIGGNEELRD